MKYPSLYSLNCSAMPRSAPKLLHGPSFVSSFPRKSVPHECGRRLAVTLFKNPAQRSDTWHLHICICKATNDALTLIFSRTHEVLCTVIPNLHQKIMESRSATFLARGNDQVQVEVQVVHSPLKLLISTRIPSIKRRPCTKVILTWILLPAPPCTMRRGEIRLHLNKPGINIKRYQQRQRSQITSRQCDIKLSFSKNTLKPPSGSKRSVSIFYVAALTSPCPVHHLDQSKTPTHQTEADLKFRHWVHRIPWLGSSSTNFQVWHSPSAFVPTLASRLYIPLEGSHKTGKDHCADPRVRLVVVRVLSYVFLCDL